jgi:hypothetical protein
MTVPSGSTVFWEFFPIWLGSWLLVALIASWRKRALARQIIALCVAIACITSYSATLFPWLWRLLLWDSPVGVDPRVIELTQQVAVAVLSTVTLGAVALAVRVVTVVSTYIASLSRPERVSSTPAEQAPMRAVDPAVE